MLNDNSVPNVIVYIINATCVTKSINVEAIFEEEYGLDEFCKEAVDSAKAEAEDDLKAYVDSLFSNEKTEIMEGVEKSKTILFLLLDISNSFVISLIDLYSIFSLPSFFCLE